MIPLLFLLLIPTVICKYEASMVKIYGKITDEVPSQLVLDEETCTFNCFNNEECILAYMSSEGYCNNYNYSMITDTVEVVKGEMEDGLKVAFKTNLLTCPSTFTSMDFAYVDRRNSANRPFQWTTTPTGWTLAKNPCPSPWKIARRPPTVTICLRYYVTPELDQAGASAFCEDMGYHMTGIAYEKEADLFRDLEDNIWIDGITSSPMSYDAPYTFMDTYTPDFLSGTPYTVIMTGSTDYCLFYEGYTISTAPCDKLLKAVLCGFKLDA